MAWDEVQPHVNYRLLELFIFGTPGKLELGYMAISEDWPEGQLVLSKKHGLENKTWCRDFEDARLIALELCMQIGLDDSQIPETREELRNRKGEGL